MYIFWDENEGFYEDCTQIIVLLLVNKLEPLK